MNARAAVLHEFLLAFVEGRDRTVPTVNQVEDLAHDLAAEDERYMNLSQGLASYDGRQGQPEPGMLNQDDLTKVCLDALHDMGDHRHCVHGG